MLKTMKAGLLLLLLLLLLLSRSGVMQRQSFSCLAELAPVLLACLVLYLFNTLWLRPLRLRRMLQKQGITGPRPSLLYGNAPEMQRLQSAAAKAPPPAGQFIAHDYTSTLFPYFERWRKGYGHVYTYSTGNKQHLYVNDPHLVKEMNQSTRLDLGKPFYVTKRLAPLLGNGILRSNGQIWAHHRKIVAPQFFTHKVEGMVGLMVGSAEPLLRKWEASIEAQAEAGGMAEVRVDEDLRSVTADVISRACFGSSYYKGKEIFSKLRVLQKIISKQGFLFGLPTVGCFPNRKKREMTNLEKEIETLIWEAIKEREEDCSEAASIEKDLMRLMLEAAAGDQCVGRDSAKRFIVDNCKNIYFAGHESTAVAASWCLMLLALHPEWQARVREEIAQSCPDGLTIDAKSLSKMKMVTRVIQEALRLYPPAAFVSREALEDARIGDLTVPKGVCIWTLIPTLHRDPANWGEDANEFRPERFANGVAGACRIPQAYVPFGLGPRRCLGRFFAMVQLKVVLTLIISRFTFSLSPNYTHSPAYRMIVEPGNGVHILIQRWKQG